MVNNIILSGMAWAATIRESIIQRHREQRGQDMMEYAVLVGAIAVVAGAAFYLAGFDFKPFTDKVQACISFNSTDCK